MTGILDIGSNTIRFTQYKDGKEVSKISLPSQILNYTYENKLSEEGIKKLCEDIVFLLKKAECEKVYAFATYATRCLENREEVKERIKEETGLNVEILSGEDEARYDFYGLLSSIDGEKTGIGLDLGGGSGQIFYFENGELKTAKSYPIGAKKVKGLFSSKIFPNKKEEENIRNYIREQLSEENGFKGETLYIMGGTAKSLAVFLSIINGKRESSVIRAEALCFVLGHMKIFPKKGLKSIFKNRYEIMASGTIIIDEVCKILGIKEVHFKMCGVNDGYYIKKVKKKTR